ncbi:MAG TPA: flavin reductase family protein [Gemmatimonadales bacterium]|nr:flavin reductase family protein [Gemmatimonadales bacterium]
MPLPQRLSPYLTDAAADSAVGLVTSGAGGKLNVMTASFFAESSHLPVLLRVAIAPRSLTHELIAASGWFGLSVLCQGHEALALECGSVSGRETPKLERLGGSHQLSPNGVPLLPNALTTSECKVISSLPLPDHVLFIGEVKSSFTQSRLSYRDPLLVSDLLAYLARA